MAQESPRNANRAHEGPDADRTREEPAEVERAMREESQESWAAPAVGLVSPAQVRGGIGGGIVGGIVGAIVGAAVGLLPLFDMTVGLRVLIIGGIFAVAGSTIGGLLGGFFKPDHDGETGDLPGEGPRSVGERRSGHAE